jgi:hypothetical protein
MNDAADSTLTPPAAPEHRNRSRSGSATRQRSHMMNFRASDAERAELERLAERAGLSVGAYIRSRALSTPTTRATRRPPLERAALAQLLGQIGKIGSNLNQIARSENRGRETQWMEEALRQALREWGEMRDAVMQALGRTGR